MGRMLRLITPFKQTNDIKFASSPRWPSRKDHCWRSRTRVSRKYCHCMFFLLPLLGFSFRKGNTILGHFLRSNQSTSISPQNVHTCPPLIVIFSAQKLTPHEMCKNHKGKKDLVFYFTLLNKISHVVSDPHHHAPISRNFGT